MIIENIKPKEKCSFCGKGKITFFKFTGKDTPSKKGVIILGSCLYCGYSCGKTQT